jgi:hypothetical protein
VFIGFRISGWLLMHNGDSIGTAVLRFCAAILGFFQPAVFIGFLWDVQKTYSCR